MWGYPDGPGTWCGGVRQNTGDSVETAFEDELQKLTTLIKHLADCVPEIY